MINKSPDGQYTFSKFEKITSKKIIEKLFHQGKKIINPPLDTRFYKDSHEDINKILISVSKSKIKSAVKRNLLKRRIRESYRLNKNILNNTGYSIAFVYISSELTSFKIIQNSLIKTLNKINVYEN